MGAGNAPPFEYTCAICGEPATIKINHKASWWYILKTYGFTGLLYGYSPDSLTRITGTCNKHKSEVRSSIPLKDFYSEERIER